MVRAHEHYWAAVQRRAQDTVAQVFAYVTAFNWLEPYKSPEQIVQYGSAFFIDTDGTLLTNYHVIDQAVGVHIQIPSLGKEQFNVEVVGACPDVDVAVLRLIASDLERLRQSLKHIPTLPLGDSDQVFRSEEILALGYPLGQQGLKSTQGIVSGREKLEGFSYIQMTAPINPGSSGGPSLSAAGEVIGINFAGVEEAQNVGYIIPINDIKPIIPAMMRNGFVRKPYLGARFCDASENLQKFLGNGTISGYYIAKVFPGLLFARAGLQPGDIIYSVDGYSVDNYGEIVVPWSEDKISIFDLMSRRSLGGILELGIYRSGKHHTISFELSAATYPPVRFRYPRLEKIDYEILGGAVVMELTLNHAQILTEYDPLFIRFTQPELQQEPQLIITTLLHESPFQRSRVLGTGDLISELNGVRVGNLDEFRRAATKSIETGFVTIKTHEQVLAVVALDEVRKTEETLAREHHYEISAATQQLINS